MKKWFTTTEAEKAYGISRRIWSSVAPSLEGKKEKGKWLIPADGVRLFAKNHHENIGEAQSQQTLTGDPNIKNRKVSKRWNNKLFLKLIQPRTLYIIAFLSLSILLVSLLIQEKEYKLGVIISSSEKNSSIIKMIKFFVNKRVSHFNNEGGVNGYPVKAIFLDDIGDISLTKKNIKNLLKEQSLIGVIGGWNSTRGKEIVKVIGGTDIPYIADFSINTLFSEYKNIYSIAKGISEELVVLGEFLKSSGKKISLLWVSRKTCIQWDITTSSRILHQKMGIK